MGRVKAYLRANLFFASWRRARAHSADLADAAGGTILPEYRAIREKAESFLDLCFDPKRAAEVTLQPIRRFGFDAAILFSDILVVPHALGQRVTFEDGEGPRLDPLKDPAATGCDCGARSIMRCLRRSTRRSRGSSRNCRPSVALLGFCGAPWTVATYMIAGRGTPDQVPARLFAYRYPEAFAELIDILVEASASYLIRQFEAGVDAVQIFDTWAGVLPAGEFRRWCIEPSRADCRGGAQADSRRENHRFSARRRNRSSDRYLDAVAVDAVGLDWTDRA